MIELRHLSAGYDDTPVLEDVSLTFPRGAVTVLLGPNGCGKTTLLKALLGMARITGGEATVDAMPLGQYTCAALARKIAYLPQTRRIPDMTVERLVLHGRFPYLRYPRRYSREDLHIARDAMEQVGIASWAGTELNRLSGGIRQKAYIAMALAQDTEAVLLDEPNTHLDIAHQIQLMELCRDLAHRGKAVVLVLHDLNLAMEYAHRIAVFSRGRLLCCGDPESVYRSGAAEQAFGVTVRRMETPEGVFYRCHKKKED